MSTSSTLAEMTPHAMMIGPLGVTVTVSETAASAVGTATEKRNVGSVVALAPGSAAGAPGPVSARGRLWQPGRRAVAAGAGTETGRERRERARAERGAGTATERGTGKGGAGAGRGGGTERGGKEPKEERRVSWVWRMAWEREERGAWRTPAEESWDEVRKEVLRERKGGETGIEREIGTETGREVTGIKTETGIERGGGTGTETASINETGVTVNEESDGRIDMPLYCHLLEIMKDWVTEVKKGKNPTHRSLKKAFRTGWA